MSGEWMINDKTVNGMKFRKYTLKPPRQQPTPQRTSWRDGIRV